MKAVYDGIDKRLKLFDDNGTESFSCEAHNDSVASNAWRSDAGCPPGTYTLQRPYTNDPPTIPEGKYFCELTGIPGHSGIGIHGGGSCSTNPLDSRQGWCPTENCIRVQNEDLQRFVDTYQSYAPITITVVQSGSSNQ